jgi:hypothetical protein
LSEEYWGVDVLTGFLRQYKSPRSILSSWVLPYRDWDIGNTLLIYIARPASIEELRNAMAKVVSEGRRDRDINGFNRFRLVVAGDLEEPEADSAAKNFAAEIGADEKMHIHFVRADMVDGL